MDNKQRLPLTRLLADGLLFSLLLAPVASRQAKPKAPASTTSASPASILAVPVKTFKVEHANMAEALLKLRSSDVSRIVIGFERIPHREGEKGSPISLAVADTTLGEIVQLLCQADPRYEYHVIEGRTISANLSGSMIEVRPKGAAHDPGDILSTRVRDYSINDTITPEAAIERVREDVPELRDFLRRKRIEWIEKTGRQPGGSPGSIMSGNMPPPPFILELSNVTVRQILDAISLKSIEMFQHGNNYDSEGRQLRSGPVGWEYDFIIHPDASTGLGGFPVWKPL